MFSRRQSLPLLALGPVAAVAFQGKAAAPVRWRPRPPFNGSPVLFESHEARPNATWLGKKIEFRKDGDLWTALAGVDLATKPGRHPLRWSEDESILVPVTARAYRASRITVAPKFVQPPPEVSKRIAEEQAVKEKFSCACRGGANFTFWHSSRLQRQDPQHPSGAGLCRGPWHRDSGGQCGTSCDRPRYVLRRRIRCPRSR